MNCPQCNTEYKCPCDSCIKKQLSNFCFTEDGNHIQCKICGFAASADWWLDYELRIYLQAKGIQNV